MKRTLIRMTARLGATLFVLCACALAQGFTQTPKSPTPDTLPGKQLIVWTETQKPHPLPASSPEMYQASSQTQTLTGTIVAQGSDLFFAGADRTYRIDNDSGDTEQLRAFIGKNVQISGSVDQGAGSVHVVRIEGR